MAPALVERVLWTRVVPEASTQELGQLWWVLEEVGRPPDREEFFKRCGRPVEKAPEVRGVELPGGTFLMGAPVTEAEPRDSERPQHPVELSPFWLSAKAVTNAQYEVFDPGHEREDFAAWKRVKEPLADHPVVNVSWFEAYLFCRWIDASLPSEAQWEYACRAGTSTPFAFGPNVRPKEVNYNGEYPYAGGKKGPYRGHTVAVGSLPANRWGLFEMHGNVFEWCQDPWHDDYEGAPVDGSAWEASAGSEVRVLRGGSWYNYARVCRSAYRYWSPPGYRGVILGFRPSRPLL